MTEERFYNELEKMDINVSDKMKMQLEKYYELLIEWNEKINLTRIVDKEAVYLKHFYDSLTLKKVYNFRNEKICDIGSGAGFPGIVLKIIFPDLKITLVDSLNKRINFLNLVIKELQLENIIAIHERAEEFAFLNREKFDLVTARAVTRLNKLSEICIPLVKEKGFFIPLKGNDKIEIEESKKAITILGAKINDIKEITLPIENSKRTIIIIEKIKKTNIKYPRRFDKIKNKPLI